MSEERVPPPPSWVVELNSPPPSRPKNAGSVPDPPGYLSSKAVSKKSEKTARKPPTQEEMDTLKLKKSWEIALGPAKQLPMQAIMGYMSGNGLQIFSIMMVFMLLVPPAYPTWDRLGDVANQKQVQGSHPGNSGYERHICKIRGREHEVTNAGRQGCIRADELSIARARDMEG